MSLATLGLGEAVGVFAQPVAASASASASDPKIVLRNPFIVAYAGADIILLLGRMKSARA